MKRHRFTGNLVEATCADCKVERRWIDEASIYVYRASGATEWTTVRPACIREVPRDIESGVRA